MHDFTSSLVRFWKTNKIGDSLAIRLWLSVFLMFLEMPAP